MKQLTLMGVAVASLLMTACNNSSSSRPSLKSDDDKVVYAIGTDMGSKLKTLMLTSNELAILKAGIDDGVNGKKGEIEPSEFLSKVGELIRGRQAKYAEKEAAASQSLLDDAAKKTGAEKTESGLVIVVTEEGKGDNPKATDRVKVNYHGTLRDGSVFDTTRERGQPASFRLDRVIPCWKEGVQKMKVGSKAELYCPASIAYGERGAQPRIPPGAALKFEVELLEIVKEDAPAARPAGKKK